jgi:hypothetical protein
VAAGDFNGDGYDELTVGAPGKDGERGAVFVYPGSAAGITTGSFITQADTESQGIYPGSALDDVSEANEEGDRFGEVLLAADFDRDGVDSLVVGAPSEAPGPYPKSGLTLFFRGVEEDGIRTKDELIEEEETVSDFNFFYTQKSYGGENEKDDLYGSALAAGDFDGDKDGYRDLAVGAPGEAPGLDPRSGGINIIPFVEIEL